MLSADCELWLDGTRVPDQDYQLVEGEPTALSGLVLQWGRTNSTDQPDTATCRFTLRDRWGATDALGMVHVGMPVEVYASGVIPGGAGADYYPNPGFADEPLGTLDPNEYQSTTVATAPTVVDKTAGRVVELHPASTAGAVTGTNISQNPSMEGGSLTGWTSGQAANYPVTLDATGQMSGTYSAVATRQGTLSGAAAVFTLYATGSTRFPVVGGQAFTYSVDVKAEQGARRVKLSVVTYDAGGVIIGAAPGGAFVINDMVAGQTYRPQITNTMQANAATAYLSVEVWTMTGNAVMGERVWLDRLRIGGFGYFDGDTPPDGTNVYSWTGTPRASTSERRSVAADSIWFPPLAFSTDPTAWDAIPRMQGGQTWQAEITARVPPGVTAALAARTYTAPTQAGAEAPGIITVTAPPIVGGLYQSTVSGTITLPAGHGAVWVALGITLALPSGQAWQDTPGVWTDHPETWADYRNAEVYRVQAAVSAAPVRRVLVFAGSVTDAVSTPVEGRPALDVDVTAADITADLGSDVVGDDPWPMEAVSARVGKIVAASKLHTPVLVDSALQPVKVSWRDVDAQPVYDLLADIAQTTGGVLWPSTHVTTGAYLWIEDPRKRAAVRTLEMVDGVVIITAGGNPSDVAVMSACDILRDPVTLSQTIAEITTTVTVSWREQTLNDEGLPDPTERSVIVTDEDAYAQYGLRRLSVGTELTTSADATALADGLIAKSRKVQWRVSGYALDTAVTLDEIPTVDNATRMGVLMDLLDGTRRAGLPLTLIDLPPWLPNDAGGVYVEGGSYTYEAGLWALNLTVTPGGSAGASVRWQDLQPTGWRWNQMDPAITWSDLIGVGI